MKRMSAVKLGSVCLLVGIIIIITPAFLFAATQSDLPDEVWARIKENLRENEYKISWDKKALPFSPKGAFQAQNRAHQLRTYFTNDGIHILPVESGYSWELGMKLLSYGYEGAPNQVHASVPEISKNRAEYHYGSVTEWYINDEHGLEQGFTLQEAPACRKEGRLIVEMSLSGSLAPSVIDQGSKLLFKDEKGRVMLRYGGLKVWDANDKILPANLSLTSGKEPSSPFRLAILVDDSDARYPITIDPVVTSQVAKITPVDGSASKYFGWDIAVSGDIMVVGAYQDGETASSAGAAYIFYRNQDGLDNWGQVAKLLVVNGEVNDFFGYSVSISNDTVAIGAVYAGVSGGGLVYVFSRNQGGADNWGQVAEISAAGMSAGDFFGNDVSIHNDTLVVGTTAIDNTAFVFSRNQGGVDNWGQVTQLTALDGTQGAFGRSVGIYNDTIVIGAYVDDDNGANSGSAFVYSRNQGGADTWGEVTKLLPSDGAADEEFGYSVAVENDTIVVGAHQDDDNGGNSGSAYIFSRNQDGADSWGQVKKLLPSDGYNTSFFGRSVSVSNDKVVVGAYGSDSAYIFEKNTGGADNWGEAVIIVASDGEINDYFGNTVSISGDTVVVGAYGDDDDGEASGSAYVFNHSGDEWVQYQKPIASDGADGDYFGASVSISNDTVVVGAHRDDNFTGAAYVFSRNQGGLDNWGQVTKIIASDAFANDFFGISVSISNDTVVVGAYRDDDNGAQSGSAYIFSRNQGGADNWGQVKKLLASDGAASDEFGYSVSISNDTVLVGSWGVNNTSSPGSAYIFSRNQGGSDNWGEMLKITASDAAVSDYFGCSVSISNDTAVVGAYGNDDNGNASGSAYILSRNQGGADNWGETAKITASDGAEYDSFGSSVSISNDTVVVGSYGDDDNGSASGSAYIFSRNQGDLDNWGQVKKLIASDSAANDYFGYSVSISNDTVVVGANYDDDNGTDSGSAYIFSRNQGGQDNWGEVLKTTALDGADTDLFGYSVSISYDTVLVGAIYDDDNGADSGSSYIYKLYEYDAPTDRTALVDLYNSTIGDSWIDNSNWKGVGIPEPDGFSEAGTECTWYGITCDVSDHVIRIELQSNNLGGTIPATIENLTSLETINLGDNQVSGTIPPELGNLPALVNLRLDNNQMSGTIPTQLGRLANLTTLYLQNNQLTGTIPFEFGSLSNIEQLDLGNNQITGPLPAALWGLSNLTSLDLADNNIGDSIPTQINGLTNLLALYLDDNHLSGPIPAEMGSLSNLLYLSLHGNHLFGAIPTALTGLVSLLDGLTDLRWNALYTMDSGLQTFLNSKQNGGDWQSTQTVAPANLAAGFPTEISINLIWDPILYQGDFGGYEHYFASTSGGPYTLFGTTDGKSTPGAIITGLTPNTTYYFRVRSLTDSHTYNANDVYSDYTSEVSASTSGVVILQYTLTVINVGQGSVTPNPGGYSYDSGTVVTLTPFPNEGWKFSEWSGDLSGNANPATITMDADKTVTATFVEKTSPVEPTADDPADEAIIPDGNPVTLDTSDYTDPDNDSHDWSHWEVWRADTETLLTGYPLISDQDMTMHDITAPLDAGLKYVWRVGYEDSDGNITWSREYTFKVGTLEDESLPVVQAGTDVGDFGMISIVHWPDDPSPQAVFNINYDPANYRIGTYDALTGSYIEFGEGLEMEPGTSYWILAREGLVINFSGIPVSLIHDMEVCLHVNEAAGNGWHMIAPPNDANYLWGDVQVGRFVEGSPGLTVAPISLSDADPSVDTLVDRRIWQWEGGSYVSYLPADNFELESYNGYWVQGKLDGVYLVFPESAQVAGLSTPVNTFLAMQGKALQWIKKWQPEIPEAIADNDTPPMPMGDLDDNTVDPVFQGCFIEIADDFDSF